MGMKVTMRGNPIELEGKDVHEGDRAPNVGLVATDLRTVLLEDYHGKVVVLASVPSLDTPVCDLEARRFNEEVTKLGNDVVVLVISMDLPFAQKRWCGAAGVDPSAGKVVTLSDHRDASFGQQYGVLIKELRLLARAVFVVSKDGVVRYKEIVPEVSSEPNYEAILRAVKECLT